MCAKISFDEDSCSIAERAFAICAPTSWNAYFAHVRQARPTRLHNGSDFQPHTVNCHLVPVFCLSKQNSNFRSARTHSCNRRASPFRLYTIVWSTENTILYTYSLSLSSSEHRRVSNILSVHSTTVFTFTLRLKKNTFTRYVRVLLLLLCVRLAYGTYVCV